MVRTILTAVLLVCLATSKINAQEDVRKIHQERIEILTRNIAADPLNGENYRSRAKERMQLNQYDRAIDDYSVCIQLDPNVASSYIARGAACVLKQDFPRAMADCEEALKIQPDLVLAYNLRAEIRLLRKQYRKALFDFDKGLQLDPDNIFSHRYKSWLLATCPDGTIRDGQLAVKEAICAGNLNLWKHAADYEIIAAAYAEIGDFDRAVEFQEKANNLNVGDKLKFMSGQKRHKFFMERKPCRDKGLEDDTVLAIAPNQKIYLYRFHPVAIEEFVPSLTR